MNKTVAAAAIAGSLLVGAGVGAALFGPTSANAQTSSTDSSGASDAPGRSDPGAGTTTGWNEDPAHEATESPEREAQEDAGQSPAPAAPNSAAPGV